MLQLNWMGYQYRPWDGYGRYALRLIAALERQGVDVAPYFAEHVNAPGWLQRKVGLAWDRLTISCLPSFYLQKAPGRHWLLTMTEGSELPDGWAEVIGKCNVERVIVPCQHNADTFRRGGVTVPIHVIPGGTCPDEFPVLNGRTDRPYTFLSLGDRGARKGWCEVWEAFFQAFGTADDTPDVRLVIKYRPDGNGMLDMIARSEGMDPRIEIWDADVQDMRDVYARADCAVLPSRSEGWGMPHREAAMMGLPVITQKYSGMDDGHTERWALVVENGKFDPIPSAFDHIAGEWRKADVTELADAMQACYRQQRGARLFGKQAAEWLRENQTWEISAQQLTELIQEYA